MSKTYGKLKRIETPDGALKAYMGRIKAPQMLSGEIAIVQKTQTRGGEWPLDVMFRESSKDEWASMGSAIHEKKNPQSNDYLRIVLSSPILERKLAGDFWLNGFPQTENANPLRSGFYEFFDIVWSQKSNMSAPSGVGSLDDLDDEIPEFNSQAEDESKAA